MNRPRVGVVVLAAGTSSRLGRPKQLLDLGGEPLIRHTLRNAISSGAERVILVLGNRAAEIAEAAGDFGQQTIVNPAFAEGQSTSMVSGLSALGSDGDAVIMMLGDQPTVGPRVLDGLIEMFAETSAAIVQPRYRGTPGNPVLFRKDLFPELLEVSGDLGAREVIKRRREDVIYIDIDQALPPDVDSDQDYEALKEIWGPG